MNAAHRLKQSRGRTLALGAVLFLTMSSATAGAPTCSQVIATVRSGDLGGMAELIEAGADLDCLLPGDDTPLLAAMRVRKFEMFELLLQAKADPDKPDGRGTAPYAFGPLVAMLKWLHALLDAGATIPAGGRGSQLLGAAAQFQEFSLILKLLDAGARCDHFSDVDLIRDLARAEDGDLLRALLHEEGRKNPFTTSLKIAVIRRDSALLRRLVSGRTAAANPAVVEAALHQATAAGDLTAIKILEGKGGGPSKQPSTIDGLCAAARSGDLETLEYYLIRNPRQIDANVNDGPPVLICASSGQGRRTVDRILAEGADPNIEFQGSDGPMTPLLSAAIRGNIKGIDALLEAGASAEANGSDLLRRAIQDPTLLRKLLVAGASVKGDSDDEASPLAERFCEPDFVQVLIELGVGLDGRDDQGSTCLAKAASRSDWVTVSLLVQAGANPHLPDSSGIPPISHVARGREPRLLAALLELGVSPDTKDPDGMTVLMHASRSWSRWGVAQLRAAGANEAVRDSRGWRAWDHYLAAFAENSTWQELKSVPALELRMPRLRPAGSDQAEDSAEMYTNRGGVIFTVQPLEGLAPEPEVDLSLLTSNRRPEVRDITWPHAIFPTVLDHPASRGQRWARWATVVRWQDRDLRFRLSAPIAMQEELPWLFEAMVSSMRAVGEQDPLLAMQPAEVRPSFGATLTWILLTGTVMLGLAFWLFKLRVRRRSRVYIGYPQSARPRDPDR